MGGRRLLDESSRHDRRRTRTAVAPVQAAPSAPGAVPRVAKKRKTFCSMGWSLNLTAAVVTVSDSCSPAASARISQDPRSLNFWKN